MELKYHKDRDCLPLDKEDASVLVRHLQRACLGGFSRVLELGCGNGVFLKSLQESGYDVYGVDIRRMSDNKRLIRANAFALPFLDASFDLVLEHYLLADLLFLQRTPRESMNELFHEAGRVLRPHGLFAMRNHGIHITGLDGRGFNLYSFYPPVRPCLQIYQKNIE